MKSQLLQQKTTQVRFKLPYTVEAVENCLYTAIEAEVETRGRRLVGGAELERTVTEVARWMCGLTGKSGILFAGRCGNGKSTMVRAMQNMLNLLRVRNPVSNVVYSLPIFTAKQLVRVFRDRPREWDAAVGRDLLAIDDLGVEPRDVKDYGNVESPIIDLISERYDRQLPMVITSNLTPQCISEIYGERIADRLRETMQVVAFTSPSFRTGK